ncbi:hypothetical protein [Streptomyces sp. Amel2xC10]|uniref:hypothetical protein n=1 Tax=Streptomyces sp. Amel2xC10 TaxID=1305826 RepID=UPI000A088566|nr:hypothetical protein [Streptomyces sp. Amel2xC10]SMF71714.1 hypothetical protein SAMN02745830_05529 [Streptomyces sp. Amel2xC10]
MANGRSGVRWGGVAGALLLAGAVAGGLLVLGGMPSAEEDPARGPVPVPCAEALAFGGAELPVGAEGAKCRMQSALDTLYEADFRMPREDVWAWVTATYPEAPEPGGPGTPACAQGVDHCFQLDVSGRPATDAHVVDLAVTYVNAGTARVRFSAFTT